MIKPYHLLLSVLIGFGLGALLLTCEGNQALADPEIHRLKEEIGWRGFKETKLTERIKKDSIENIELAKDVISERSRAQKAELEAIKAKRYYTEVRKAIP